MAKKKYKVTLYFHTSGSAIVEAENEKEAIEKANWEILDEDLLGNMQEDSAPDVEELDPKNHIFR